MASATKLKVSAIEAFLLRNHENSTAQLRGRSPARATIWFVQATKACATADLFQIPSPQPQPPNRSEVPNHWESTEPGGSECARPGQMLPSGDGQPFPSKRVDLLLIHAPAFFDFRDRDDIFFPY